MNPTRRPQCQRLANNEEADKTRLLLQSLPGSYYLSRKICHSTTCEACPTLPPAGPEEPIGRSIRNDLLSHIHPDQLTMCPEPSTVTKANLVVFSSPSTILTLTSLNLPASTSFPFFSLFQGFKSNDVNAAWPFQARLAVHRFAPAVLQARSRLPW